MFFSFSFWSFPSEITKTLRTTDIYPEFLSLFMVISILVLYSIFRTIYASCFPWGAQNEEFHIYFIWIWECIKSEHIYTRLFSLTPTIHVCCDWSMGAFKKENCPNKPPTREKPPSRYFNIIPVNYALPTLSTGTGTGAGRVHHSSRLLFTMTNTWSFNWTVDTYFTRYKKSPYAYAITRPDAYNNISIQYWNGLADWPNRHVTQ